MAVHCVNHCAGCGQHFHSVTLFDRHLDRKHRTGDCLACRRGVPHEYRHRARIDAALVSGTCDLSDEPGTHPAQIRVGAASKWAGETARISKGSPVRDGDENGTP